MSSLMTDAIKSTLDAEGDREAAKKRLIERMRNAKDIGLKGKIPWTRDELHER